MRLRIALVLLFAACSSPDQGTAVDGGSGGSAMGGASPSGDGGSPGSGGVPGSGGQSAPGSGGQVAPADGGSGGIGVDDGGARDGGADGAGPAAGLGPAGGACPGGQYPMSLPATKTATLVRGGFGGELEGPVWVAAQKALYFTQAGGGNVNGRINKYTPADGKFTTPVMNVGIGGLAVDTQGQLLAASYDRRSITRIDPVTGLRTDVAGGDSYMGQPFNEVNDIVMRNDGNIYFSDPQYDSVPRGTRPMAFYRLSPPPESKVSLVFSAAGANGIALSPNGMFLYLGVTESNGPPLHRMTLNADGSINGAGVAWKEPSSDGMAVDCAGNLYLAVADGANSIRVVSPTDQVLGDITGLGAGYVTNSAFGDEDRQTLYITTSDGLYKIRLNVPGFPN